MSSIVKITGAASLALHAMSYLAVHADQGMTSTREVAEAFKCSEDHLKKVVQRLVRAGVIKTVRGPRGGIALARPPAKITLLEIFEAMEGPLNDNNCILGNPVCQYKECILGGLTESLNKQARAYLSKTKLSQLAKRIAGTDG